MKKYFITDISELSDAACVAIRAVAGSDIRTISGDRYLIKCKIKPVELKNIELAQSKTFDEELYNDIKSVKTTRIEGLN